MSNDKRLFLAVNLVGLAVLGLLLNLTSPTEVGPAGVLVFFTTIYALVYSWFLAIFRLFLRLAFGRKKETRKEMLGTAIAAFLPLMLMMAMSFGGLNWITGILIAAIVLIAEFLVGKLI